MSPEAVEIAKEEAVESKFAERETTPEEKRISVITQVRNQLTQMQPEFAKALAPHISPEKFVRVVMTAIQKTPELLRADRGSLFAACTSAAQESLLPDGREGAMVIYRTKDGMKVQWQPMVAGILKKIRNSGELKSISAHVVHEKDTFKTWVDETGEHFKHEPILVGERGKEIGAYCLATTHDGGIYFEFMTVDEIEKIRQCSRAKDSGPWISFWGEMAKKTVIRRLSKKLPMSTDLESVIRRDDDLIDLEPKHESYEQHEWIPGISPRQTIDGFLKKLKGVQNAPILIADVLGNLEKQGHSEVAKKIHEKAIEEKIIQNEKKELPSLQGSEKLPFEV